MPTTAPIDPDRLDWSAAEGWFQDHGRLALAAPPRGSALRLRRNHGARETAPAATFEARFRAGAHPGEWRPHWRPVRVIAIRSSERVTLGGRAVAARRGDMLIRDASGACALVSGATFRADFLPVGGDAEAPPLYPFAPASQWPFA